MSAFLPIFVSPQTAPNAISRGETVTDTLAQGSKDQSTPLDHTFSPVFAQVLREQEESPTLLKKLQAVASTDPQEADMLQPGLVQKDLRNLEVVGSSHSIEKALPDSHAYGNQPSTHSKVAALPATDSDPLIDSAKVVSPKVLDRPFTTTHAFIPDQAPRFLFEQVPLPGNFPTIAFSSFNGTQASTNELISSPALQARNGEPIPGSIRQALESEGNYSGKLQSTGPQVLESGLISQRAPVPKFAEGGVVPQQAPVPKIAEVGVVAQQLPQGSEGKLASSGLKQEERRATPKMASLAKEVPSGQPHVSRLIQEDEPLKFSNLPRSTPSPIGSYNLRTPYVPPVTAVQQDAPTGLTQALVPGLSAPKPIFGMSSIGHNVSNPVINQRTTIPVDLPGEPGLLGKGDRAQTLVEASVKSQGVDPSGGQGLGSGMNQFHNPQSGYQQPAATLAQGMGMRGLEERGPELPVPALQRLQMDVQLSENQRVSIDVGVQNRQVYAGLTMDHSVLRNLANQFVPQLENQLADVDMELQEFSAEVREERDREGDKLLHDSGYHQADESGGKSPGDVSSPSNIRNQQEERGLYLVA